MKTIAFTLFLAATLAASLAKQCFCPDNYTPLCGSDGITYSNPCEFTCLAPLGQVKIVKAGECSAELPCVCNRMFQPVCGSNGRTYTNKCELGCAARKERNLRVVYEGECNSAQPRCFCPPIIYAPVCGTDQVTYENLCQMECANVQMAHEGPCF